ncbi:MAG: MFS transporter [Planctomycetia bacterium]|nr:MFS transporter [Planctomycetia bacterium]
MAKRANAVDSGTAIGVAAAGDAPAGQEAARLRDLSRHQWNSGIAAWLGWLFDGLDMHLYTLVAITFVGELLHTDKTNPQVAYYSSWIQASFLIGWALGGGLFGVIGDRIGRSRALMLTILTYALFTGLSYFAQAWWHLLVFRFVAALGIGGEWAVGASLLSETWPRRWRPWMAAVLQTAVNLGTLLASLALFLMADQPPRNVFLVGVVPALVVLWIRRAVPETEQWREARAANRHEVPRIVDLFGPHLLWITVRTLAVCGLALTAHWAFMFWCSQQLRNLPDLAGWTEGQRSELVSGAMTIVMVSSIAGNFLAALVARGLGYRFAIALFCLGYFAAMLGAYSIPRDYSDLRPWLVAIGICQGVFALFTMYLPPLFPTLLRTTGAGFCYNFGRLAAAFGTVFFGLMSKVGDHRMALLYAGFLFLPAAAIACVLPEPLDGRLPEPVT